LHDLGAENYLKPDGWRANTASNADKHMLLRLLIAFDKDVVTWGRGDVGTW